MAVINSTIDSGASAGAQLPFPPSPAARVRDATSRAQHNAVLPTQRNVKEVILTDTRIETWFPSFYPEDLVGRITQTLYVCTWCFRYTTEYQPFLGHSKCCSFRGHESIGRTIYESGPIKICEVDGEEHKIFAQNLSLFAKLFLDTKSVFFDVTTFLYYVLYVKDDAMPNAPPRIVGFFSKEKLSWDSNNLACICVFPPWQKRGFGQILMGTSYILSKYDGRLGGPEKPLSELGRKAYIQFWSATIARHVVKLPLKKKVTVQGICEATFILPEDIIATLQEMNVVERKSHGKGAAIINKAAITAWMSAHKVDMTGPVDEDAYIDLAEAPTSETGE